jgi:hypothetical protein
MEVVLENQKTKKVRKRKKDNQFYQRPSQTAGAFSCNLDNFFFSNTILEKVICMPLSITVLNQDIKF